MNSDQFLGLIQYPYHVLLFQNVDGNNVCNGAILSNEWILTTASCLLGYQVITLLAGLTNPRGMFQTQINRTEFFVHPNYSQFSLENDIALLKLLNRLPFSKHIQPIALPNQQQQQSKFNGEIGFATGFVDSKDEGTKGKFNVFKIKVITNEECEKFYKLLVKPKMLCAFAIYKNKQKPVGIDNSGGSLAIVNNGGEDILIGIMNFYIFTHTKRFPMGFVRVSEHVDWIERVSDSQIADGERL